MQPTGPVSYSNVEALFAAKCLTCHTGASASNGNVDLSSYDALMASGVVMPSDLGASELYQALENRSMPPFNPLGSSEVNLVRSWILQGAEGPAAMPNVRPVAQAGVDTVVTETATYVDFQGVSADSDGTVTSTRWRQVSGPSATTLTDLGSSLVRVANFSRGVYIFEFAATDNRGESSSDQVQLTVQAAAASNVAPLVNAGSDAAATVGGANVRFTAMASDSDGSVQSMTWSQISGPNSATLSGTTSLILTVSNFVVGTYVFELRVQDNRGAVATDRVSLVVTAQAAVTFAQVNSTILVPRCLNCHGGSRTAGGYSVSTYANTMRRVQAGNAGQSALYTEVASDSMPASSAPLSAAQKTMLQTWINQGALNN